MLSINPKKWFQKSGLSHTGRELKTAAIELSPDSFLAFAFGGSGWVSDRRARAFYQNTSAVATAVDMIADSINQINPVLKTRDGKYIEDHEIIKLLKKPNGFEIWHQFMGDLARNYLLKRDALIVMPGNVKFPPLEIWNQRLMNASVMESGDGYPDAYMVSSGVLTGIYKRVENRRGRMVNFYDGTAKELYHIKGYSSRSNNIESDSPLQAAALEARQLIQGKYHNVKLLENGGRLSLLVTFNDEDIISDDEHQNRVRRLNEQFGGVSKAGKIGVISGADIQHVTEFGKSNKDMDFVDLETMAGNAIYLRYQIPLALVTNDASTFDNMKTGVQLLYDNAVLPAANIIFSALSWALLPRYKMDPSAESITFNPESIEPLKVRKLEELEKRRKIGIESINELRATMTDKSPVEGGDVIYQNKSLVPLGTKPEEQVNNEQNNEERPTESTNRI